MDPSKEKILPWLIDEAGIFFVYLDASGKILFCNKRVEDIVSCKSGEAEGKAWLDLLYPKDAEKIKRQMFKAILDDSLRHKRGNIFEGVISDGASADRFIYWNIAPAISGTGGVDGLILAGSDISGLQQQESSAKRIDDTLKNILSSIKEYALYTVNPEGNITYFAMGSESMLGWQKSDIIFKHVSLLHPSEALSGLGDALEKVKSSGRQEIETELVRKDGEMVPVALNIIPFMDAGENLAGYIFIAKDITERKKFEYEIFQAEKLASIGQLAAGIAHEISNPLFVISGRTELLLGNKELPSEALEALNLVSSQIQRIRDLVDRVLKFSRKSSPKLEVININVIIEAALSLASYQRPPAAGITVVKDLMPQGALVKGDFNQLQDVFVNLFLNAYQAMPDIGTLRVKAVSMGDGYAQISVSDTGSGILESNLKNIFMPFFSTKKVGTGLGLSICHNIIKNHKGSISVESRAGKGTTFKVRLPFANEAGG